MTAAVRILVLLLLPFAAVACEDSTVADAPPAYAETFGNDDLRLTITVSDTDVRTVDRIAFHVELSAGAEIGGVELDIPTEPAPEDWPRDGAEPPARLGAFRVLREVSEPATLTEFGGARRSRTLTLEPFLPGEYVIPSISVRANAAEVTSEPISVAVRSVLADPENPPDDVAALRVRTRMDQAEQRTPWIAMVVLLAAAGCVAVFVARRRRAGRPTDAAAAAAERLASLAESPNENDAPERLDEVVSLLELAGQSRLGLPAGARWPEIAALLPESTDARSLAEQLESARFAGEGVTPEHAAAITRSAANIAERLATAEAPA
ncbi:MAG: hypothetical protein AAF138_05750 [Planctomycetota bacterium]